MSKNLLSATLGVAMLLAPATSANEFEGALRDVADNQLVSWTVEPALIAAIRAQNGAHSGMTQDQIDAMDKTWRAEVDAASGPLIDEVLNRTGSAWLREQKEAMGGLITEVFVMDNHGLNVLASDVTSDYWQGDEAKFQETYPKGPGTIHIGEVEFDDSSQSYQSQVSMVIADPDSGDAIGAITFGLNLEYLQ